MSDPAVYKNILKSATIFTRMSPDQKAMIVQEFQQQGNIVGMCGDGANDCPALKAANVGLSLSEAEASLAAPFLSKTIDISSVETLLKEGRGALATCVQCFKFMALYSMIQTISVVYLYTRGSNLSDEAFLFVDLIIALPLSITMTYTESRTKLSKQRPSDSLLSIPILSSVLGQIIIQILYQVRNLSRLVIYF